MQGKKQSDGYPQCQTGMHGNFHKNLPSYSAVSGSKATLYREYSTVFMQLSHFNHQVITGSQYKNQ